MTFSALEISARVLELRNGFKLLTFDVERQVIFLVDNVLHHVQECDEVRVVFEFAEHDPFLGINGCNSTAF